jgi:secretion/DNA translocation related CpaE-like protein
LERDPQARLALLELSGRWLHRSRVTSTPGNLLTLIDDAELRNTVERVAAAVELRVSIVAGVPTRRAWLAAAAVVLDETSARRCIGLGLPRREAVGLLTADPAVSTVWEIAIAIGAQRVYHLPSDEGELMKRLAESADHPAVGLRPGQVIAVVAGRGGAGASVLSAALALDAGRALLIDMDPCSGGLDLVLGGEAGVGLRWPDLVLQGGRLGWESVRDALPRHGELSVLSGARRSHELEPGPVESVINAGRRGGVTVVCDLPRRMTDAVGCAMDSADLIVVIATCDVRGAAATSALVPMIRAVNPNIGLVIRGPAPGGLRPREIADAAGLPMIAAMRPEPKLDQRLDRGGLRLRRRSPLASAARAVLAVLAHHHSGRTA